MTFLNNFIDLPKRILLGFSLDLAIASPFRRFSTTLYYSSFGDFTETLIVSLAVISTIEIQGATNGKKVLYSYYCPARAIKGT
jgi:hypothetical protein